MIFLETAEKSIVIEIGTILLDSNNVKKKKIFFIIILIYKKHQILPFHQQLQQGPAFQPPQSLSEL